MSFEAFIKIDGITGESRDDQHTDEIEISSYGFSISHPSTGVSGAGGHSGGKASFGDLFISKEIDAASPILYLAAADGRSIPNVVLTLARAGGDKMVFLRVEMTNVMITGVTPSGSGGAIDSLPMEQVSMACETVKWTYTKQGTDGKAVGDVSAGWDIAKGAKK